MARYRCIHCETLMDSKCAARRNWFLENRIHAMLDNAISTEAVSNEPVEGAWTVTVSIIVTPDGPSNELDVTVEAIATLHTIIEKCMRGDDGYPTIKQLVCGHEFALVSETCEFGCCQRHTKGED